MLQVEQNLSGLAPAHTNPAGCRKKPYASRVPCLTMFIAGLYLQHTYDTSNGRFIIGQSIRIQFDAINPIQYRANSDEELPAEPVVCDPSNRDGDDERRASPFYNDNTIPVNFFFFQLLSYFFVFSSLLLAFFFSLSSLFLVVFFSLPGFLFFFLHPTWQAGRQGERE